MNIPFILNGEDVVIQANPEERLVSVLREDFHLLGSKEGCLTGRCGSCTVFCNNLLMPSCLLKMYQIVHSEIVTIEGFMQTEEYQLVVKSFDAVGVQMCGYCNTGKILTAASFLERKTVPEPDEIKEAFKGTLCRCTDIEDLINGITYMLNLRKKR